MASQNGGPLLIDTSTGHQFDHTRQFYQSSSYVELQHSTSAASARMFQQSDQLASSESYEGRTTSSSRSRNDSNTYSIQTDISNSDQMPKGEINDISNPVYEDIKNVHVHKRQFNGVSSAGLKEDRMRTRSLSREGSRQQQRKGRRDDKTATRFRDTNNNISGKVQYFTPQSIRRQNVTGERHQDNLNFNATNVFHAAKPKHRREEEREKLMKELEIDRQAVSEQLYKGEFQLSSNTNSFDDSWNPHYHDSGSNSLDSEALVDSCLKDLEGHRLVENISTNNNTIKYSGNKMNMYDDRLGSIKSSSYGYTQQANSSYSNYNGNAQHDSSYKTSLQVYNNNAADISLGSLRSHDVMEDTYEFGTNVRRTPSSRSAARIPSRSNSVRSNRSSNRIADAEEYDIIIADQSDSHSRRSSISRRSEPPGYNSIHHNKYGSTQRSYIEEYGAQRRHSGDYSSAQQQIGNHNNSQHRRMEKYSNVRRSQSMPRSRSLPRNGTGPRNDAYKSYTLPRKHLSPSVASTPEPSSEAIVEEQRVNADGSTVVIRRVVTATTTHAYHENEPPKVEVHISPATETLISPPISPRHVAMNNSHHDMQTSQEYEQTAMSYNENGYEATDYDLKQGRRSGRESVASSHRNSNQLNGYPGQTQCKACENNVDINTSYTEYNVTNTYVNENDINYQYTGGGDGGRPGSKASSRYQVDGGQRMSDYVMTGTGDAVYHDDTSSAIKGSYTVNLEDKKIMNKHEVSLLDLLMFLKTDDSVLKSNAAGYIMHISYNDDEVKNRIREVDMIPHLVKLLDDEDEDCHRNAAGALKNLSCGRFIDDNKVAIQECGGIAACTRLLYRTSWIEVREHVTGILWNVSSIESIKRDILKDAVEAVAELIVIPLSGWEKQHAELGNKPTAVTWSVLLRNSTGILRNVSSYGVEARTKMRAIDGLVDSLVWILNAAVTSLDREDINNKIVENVTCTLRNLSYKVDTEIDRNIYPDAAKISAKDGTDGAPYNDNQPHDLNKENNPERVSQTEYISQDGLKGCIGMKKRPFIKKRKKGSRGASFTGTTANKKPPPEEWKYLVPVQEHRPTPIGAELLWQQETVSIYIYLLANSENPITLEAAAAAIHNLCGCKWNWAGLLRVHVRLQKGIPPMHDLLSVDQQFVVRSVAYALRNLAFDKTNKWSIGKFAHAGLIQILPAADMNGNAKKPSEYTICAVLSVLQVLVYRDYHNSKYVKDDEGIPKLVALTRSSDGGRSEGKSHRVYSERTVLEANRVLLYMWEFKECREAISETGWSHTKAEDAEKGFKNNTRKKKQDAEMFAEMEMEESSIAIERDTRRYINVDDKELELSRQNQRSSYGRHDDVEMQEVGHKDVSRDEVSEDEPLVRRGTSQKKKKKNWFKTKSNNKEEKKRSNEKSKLMDGEQDTSV